MNCGDKVSRELPSGPGHQEPHRAPSLWTSAPDWTSVTSQEQQCPHDAVITSVKETPRGYYQSQVLQRHKVVVEIEIDSHAYQTLSGIIADLRSRVVERYRCVCQSSS